MSAEQTPGLRFIAAVADNLSPTVAGRISDAWRTFSDKADFDCEADQGRALAIALASVDVPTAASQIDQLVLLGAFIHGPGIYLTAEKAFRHPLLGRWAAATFSDALADAISSGRYAMLAAHDTPSFLSFELVEESDAIRRGVVRVSFAARDGVDIAVDLEFGAQAQASFARVNVAGGTNVFNIGMALRSNGATSDVEAHLDNGRLSSISGQAVH